MKKNCKIWAWIKSIFSRPTIPVEPPVEPPYIPKKTALLFGINDYPGIQNDLAGCVNDVKDVEFKVKALWPEFVTKLFLNFQVTRNRFLTELKTAVHALIPHSNDVLLVWNSSHGTQVYDISGDESDGYDEALYLYDGPVLDDEINEILQDIPEGVTVILCFDTCFSGTVTKAIDTNRKVKFYQMPGVPIRKNIKKRFAENFDGNWIVYSGCSENEYSYDAYFDDKPNGAFTYYALKTIERGIDYWKWFMDIRTYLPNKNHPQSPTLEGPDEKLTKPILT